MPSKEFQGFLEKKIGKFAYFMIYAVLEWIMIILLFINGFLSLFANEFARFFEMRMPCLICTRFNNIFLHKDSKFCCNNSLCEAHKKDISALAYCHMHKKLSDTGSMCEGCLLSFATENGSPDCGKYKSLVGILHKDIDCFVDLKNDKKLAKNKDNGEQDDGNGVVSKCSCCGEHLKTRTSSTYGRGLTMNAPMPSARAPLLDSGNEEWCKMELPHVKYTELKFNSDNESEVLDDENVSNGGGREDITATTMPLLPDSEDINEGIIRTPTFNNENKFFGIPLSDSAQSSPRWDNKGTRKLSDDDASVLNGVDGESILHSLNRQVRLDRKSLIDLYMELDEERNASSVAANNAMAMITRLQAEKATVQMEASQYQRLMKEQVEYDQEAIQFLQDMLSKAEEDIRLLESEVEEYREKHGPIRKQDSDICEVDEDYREFKSNSFSSSSEKSDCGIFVGVNRNENGHSYEEGDPNDLLSEGQRSHLLAILTDMEKKMYTSSDEGSDSLEVDNIEYVEATKGENEDKAMLKQQISLIKDELTTVEAYGGFLKHAATTLQQGGSEAKLLNEIAQHLRKLRCDDKISSEEINA